MLFKEIFQNVEVEANSIYAQLKAGTKSYITKGFNYNCFGFTTEVNVF